jgi:hypothetical protein
MEMNLKLREERSEVLHDKDIREPLFDFLEEHYGKIRIIEEKQMGRSRADVVMVTSDMVIGIEIKSDADTYERLKRQVRDYNKYFDRNIIAVGSTHALRVTEHVPESWGIISVEEDKGKFDFYVVREPLNNQKRKMEYKMSFLWRQEFAHILSENGMHKYSGKSKRYIAGKIIEKVPEDILNEQISDELFERDYTTYEETTGVHHGGFENETFKDTGYIK